MPPPGGRAKRVGGGLLQQQLVNALSLGCVYALFALGFTLVFGVLGVINLSHGAVFMVGAYVALQLITQFDLPLWAGLAAAAAGSGIVGILIDVLVLKRLRKRGSSIALEAANPAYETRVLGPDRVKIQGRLVNLMRRY